MIHIANEHIHKLMLNFIIVKQHSKELLVLFESIDECIINPVIVDHGELVQLVVLGSRLQFRILLHEVFDLQNSCSYNFCVIVPKYLCPLTLNYNPLLM